MRFTFSIAVALTLALQTPAGAVVAISGSSNINASASVDGIGTDTGSESATLNGFHTGSEINATAGVGDEQAGAFVFGRTDTTWGTPDFGIVQFYRQITLLGQDKTVSGAFDGSIVPDWTYTFRAEKSGDFFIDYDVFVVGPKVGLQGWSIDWSGSGGGLDLRNPADPTANGRFSRPIAKGEIYTVALRNDAHVDATRTSDSQLLGRFEWTVAESYVPEPASWALMIFGLGMVGQKMRRHRQSALMAPSTGPQRQLVDRLTASARASVGYWMAYRQLEIARHVSIGSEA